MFTVALIVVLALKLAEEEEALKAARPEEWAKYSEILGFSDIDLLGFLDICTDYRVLQRVRMLKHLEQIHDIDIAAECISQGKTNQELNSQSEQFQQDKEARMVSAR